MNSRVRFCCHNILFLRSMCSQGSPRWTVVREVEGSSPSWTKTQGLKITEENVLPFYNVKKWIDILVFLDKDE